MVQKTILYAILVALGFGAGVYYSKSSSQSDYKEVRGSFSKYTFINPLLECNLGDEYLTGQIKPSRNNLQALIDSEIKAKNLTFASLYYRDLNNGPWLGINEQTRFFPASLMKVPLLMYFYKQTETDPNILVKPIGSSHIPDEITFDQYYAPKQTIKIASSTTIGDLIDSAIRYSDNRAAEALVNIMPPDGISKLLTDLQLDAPDPASDYMTVKDYATFFRILFNASYLDYEKSESALKLLSQTDFDKGLTRYLPNDLVVSHKFGEKTDDIMQIKQLHDCGIVYYPKHPYLICVMTKGYDMDKLGDAIGKISKLVYEEIKAEK